MPKKANAAFEKRLKKAQKSWEEGVKEKKNLGGSNVDDGTYKTGLSAASLMESNKQELLVLLKFKIKEGDFKGEEVPRFYNLEGKNAAKSLAFLQFDLEKMGADVPEDLSDIPEILEKLLKEKPSLLISLRTNGEYQNAKVVRLINDEDGEEEDEDTDEDEEDEDDEKPKKKAKASDDDDDEDEEEETEDEEDDEEEDDEDEEEDSDDEDEDEEEEEDEKSKKKKGKKVTEEEDDEDEEEDDDDEDSDDEEEDDEDEEEADDKLEIEEGGKVSVPYKAGKVKATILKIFEKTEKVKVKLANGKVMKFSYSDLS